MGLMEKKDKLVRLGHFPRRRSGTGNGGSGTISLVILIRQLGPEYRVADSAINPLAQTPNVSHGAISITSPWSPQEHFPLPGLQHPYLASMPLLSASADTFILGATVCLVVFARRRHAPAPAKNARKSKHWPLITATLAIHTLYMIYTLSFKAPPNLFARLHLPLSMPSQRIRAMLLSRTGMREEDYLPEHIEELLMRLNTSDLRTYFVRSVIVLPTHVRSTLIPFNRLGSAKRRYKSVSGAQPSQTMRHTHSPQSCYPTSRKQHSSGS